jgi:hypothetical protein
MSTIIATAVGAVLGFGSAVFYDDASKTEKVNACISNTMALYQSLEYKDISKQCNKAFD